RGGGRNVPQSRQIRPPPSPRRQIATKITMPLSTSPALARPRRPVRVNSSPTAAMIAPTAANGISSQLVIPTSGIRAKTIQTIARMPQTRLTIPMCVLQSAGRDARWRDGGCETIVAQRAAAGLQPLLRMARPDAIGREARAFGSAPRPAGRGSLFTRSGHRALTRAQNIHVLLVATPGRQDAAHRSCCCDASVTAFSKPRSRVGRLDLLGWAFACRVSGALESANRSRVINVARPQ